MSSYLQTTVSVRLWVLLLLVLGLCSLAYVTTGPHPTYMYVNQTPTRGRANANEGISNKDTHMINTTFSCIEAHLQNVRFPMCLLPSSEDRILSATVRETAGNLYESADLTYFLSLVREDMGVIDIGANLGTYTLPAAHTGHQVIAVEMVPRTAAHLRASITKGGITNKVTLINSAVSNKRTKFMIGHSLTNQGDSFYRNVRNLT